MRTKNTAKLYAFYKPFQVLCQFSKEGDKKTLKDFIDIPMIYPAGRLDYDSEGLLLLTNDGKLQNKISSPKFEKEKTYWVQIEGLPMVESLEKLKTGVVLNDGLTKPCKARLLDGPEDLGKIERLGKRVPDIRYRASIPTSWMEIILTEGKNRQVRRMCANINHPCLRLIRIQIGQHNLFDLNLKPGDITPLPHPLSGQK